jgi:hypothetical protein
MIIPDIMHYENTTFNIVLSSQLPISKDHQHSESQKRNRASLNSAS